MWSFARAVALASLVASTVTAELSFVASVQQQGQDVDASSLDFVRVPALGHGKHAPRAHRGHNKAAERDAISYSSNWCGASQHTTASDGIASVVGSFMVPDLTLRPGKPAPQFAAAWVGIDGAECNTTLLQAGVTTIVRAESNRDTLEAETGVTETVDRSTPTADRARRRGGSGTRRRPTPSRASRSSRTTG